MTPRCSLCGEFESENTSILQGYDVCFECIESLIENEQERRGVVEDARMLRQGQSGADAASHRMSEAQKVR